SRSRSAAHGSAARWAVSSQAPARGSTSSARTSPEGSACRSTAVSPGSRAALMPSGAASRCAAPRGPSFASHLVADHLGKAHPMPMLLLLGSTAALLRGRLALGCTWVAPDECWPNTSGGFGGGGTIPIGAGVGAPTPGDSPAAPPRGPLANSGTPNP